MPKIALIIAFRNFCDEEYFIPQDIFLKAGFDIKTISSEKGLAIGGSGGEAEVDISFEDFNISEFDAIVFVGGPGAYKYIDDQSIWQIVRDTIKQEKILAAICIAPVILARAGVLEAKKATVWSSVMDKKPIRILEENGAKYQDKAVVQDGKIITANGPSSAKEFAETIVQSMLNSITR